jgi:cell division protein FtsB
MTRRGRRARWTAAAAISPLAAAAFAGSTLWATRHLPATAAGSSSGSSSTGGTDAAAAQADANAQHSMELQQSLDDEAARVADLEQQVTELRSQAMALADHRTTKTTPATTARTTTQTTNTQTTNTRTTTTRSAPVTARRTVVRAAPPPAVHTLTGGS